MAQYLDLEGTKVLANKIKENERKVAFVGSDEPASNGWYKVASQTCSGYGNQNITFQVTSTYGNYNFGQLQLQIRSDNTSITCKRLSWLTRTGLDPNHYVVVVNGMTWTLYAYQPNTQYGRLCFEILSRSAIGAKNDAWPLTFKDNMTKETTAPTPTVTSSDGATVAYANSAAKLATARTIALTGGATGTATSFDGSGNISIPVTTLDASKIRGFCENASGDWNDYTQTGFYMGANLTNQPTAGSDANAWKYVIVSKHNDSWVNQLAFDFNGKYMWKRNKVNGAWSAWSQVYTATSKPSKSDVGLGSVDNTSDLNKPISTATQTALDGKSSYAPTYEFSEGQGVTAYRKLFTITPTGTYCNGVYKFQIASRTIGVCDVEVSIVSNNDKYISATITYEGNSTIGNSLRGYLFKNTSSGITTFEMYYVVPAWDYVKVYNKTLNPRTFTLTTNNSSVSALPTTATSSVTITPRNWLGNSATATKLQTARSIALTGAITGSVNFDGSGNVSMTTNEGNVSFKQLGEVGAATDWNTLTTAGCYKVQVPKWGGADTHHSPNSYGNIYQYGVLLVFKSAIIHEDRTVQIYIPHRDTNITESIILTRMLNGTTWNSWKPIFKGIDKAYIGLGNVDNTSDLNKPISTATQTALNGKANSSHTHDDRYYTESEIDTKLNVLKELAKPNLFKNGDFKLWSKGTTFTNPTTSITADSWKQHTDLTSGNITISNKSGNMYIEIGNDVVSVQSYYLSTVQDFKHGVSGDLIASIKFKQSKPNMLSFYGTQSNSVVNEFQVLTKKLNGIQENDYFWFDIIAKGNIEIEYVKLERGTIATPLIKRSYEEEFTFTHPYNEDISNPNLLINGDFQVWQRGEGININKAKQYTADRWCVYKENYTLGGSVSKYGTVKNELLIRPANVATSSIYYLQQAIESTTVNTLRGKTVTFSANVRCSKSVTVIFGAVYSETGEVIPGGNTNVCLAKEVNCTVGSEQRVSLTFTVPKNASGLGPYIGVKFKGETSEDYLAVSEAKLEVGSVATPFTPRPYGEELALCQRYYTKIATGFEINKYQNDITYAVVVPCTMRVRPSIIGFSVWTNTATGINLSNFSSSVTDMITNQVNVRVSKTNHGLLNANTHLNIDGFDAEIY